LITIGSFALQSIACACAMAQEGQRRWKSELPRIKPHSKVDPVQRNISTSAVEPVYRFLAHLLWRWKAEDGSHAMKDQNVPKDYPG
jgi:hypothetical protein